MSGGCQYRGRRVLCRSVLVRPRNGIDEAWYERTQNDTETRVVNQCRGVGERFLSLFLTSLARMSTGSHALCVVLCVV